MASSGDSSGDIEWCSDSEKKKKDKEELCRKRRHSSSSNQEREHSPKKKRKKSKKKKSKKKKKGEDRRKHTAKVKVPELKDNSKVQPDDARVSEQANAMRPMTKEEWDAKQSVIRRVYDPETGRSRLIKGDGEVLEEIVSRERHHEISKNATLMDGASYQAKAVAQIHR